MTRKCTITFEPKGKEKHLSLVGSMLLNKKMTENLFSWRKQNQSQNKFIVLCTIFVLHNKKIRIIFVFSSSIFIDLEEWNVNVFK